MKKGEISFDLVMADDMDFVEGTYRPEGEDWSVLIISRFSEDEVASREGRWESGVTGLYFQVPNDFELNETSTKLLLDSMVPGYAWTTVRGPDSMVLR